MRISSIFYLFNSNKLRFIKGVLQLIYSSKHSMIDLIRKVKIISILFNNVKN